MDPLVCYQEMVEDYLENKVQEAKQKASNLVRWFSNNGFYPEPYDGLSRWRMREEMWTVIGAVRQLKL